MESQRSKRKPTPEASIQIRKVSQPSFPRKVALSFSRVAPYTATPSAQRSYIFEKKAVLTRTRSSNVYNDETSKIMQYQ